MASGLNLHLLYRAFMPAFRDRYTPRAVDDGATVVGSLDGAVDGATVLGSLDGASVSSEDVGCEDVGSSVGFAVEGCAVGANIGACVVASSFVKRTISNVAALKLLHSATR